MPPSFPTRHQASQTENSLRFSADGFARHHDPVPRGVVVGRNGRVDRLSGGRGTVRQNTLPLGPFKQLQNASMQYTPLVCTAPTAYQPMESGNVAPAVVATPYEHVVLGVLGLDDVAPDLAPPQGPIVLRAAPWNH